MASNDPSTIEQKVSVLDALKERLKAVIEKELDALVVKLEQNSFVGKIEDALESFQALEGQLLALYAEADGGNRSLGVPLLNAMRFGFKRARK